MVFKYSVKADDIILFMLKYRGLIPVNSMQGTYGNQDFEYVIRDNFNMSRMEYKRFIVQLKQDGIIYIQKYKRYGYGYYTSHWLDNKKLINDYGIAVSVSNDNNITNKIVSTSLASSIINFADSMQDDTKHLWQTACNTIYNKAVNDKYDRHFTINGKGKMTYTPKGRMTVTNDDRDKWMADSKYRSEIKFGKGLRKIFAYQNIKVPDSIIEYFANRLKGMYTFQGNIKIVKGELIKKWYNGANYSSDNTESLGNSCMRHTSCEDYFDIYTENKDKIQMIIATDYNDKLIGRAILWNTDSHGLFCDRIYGTRMTIEAVKNYAKRLGAYTKYEQSYSNAKIVSSTGELINDEIQIKLNKGGFGYYPYMDTLKYTDDISNENELYLNSESGDYELESTDGGPNSNYVTLHDGNREHADNARYIDRYGEWYHMDDTIYSEHHNEDILYESSISINEGTDYAWDDCDDFKYVEEEEQWMHINEIVWSDYEGEYLHNYEECVIHGYISTSHSQVIEVNGDDYTCHNSVDVEELLENEIITEEDYAEYQS